MPTRILKNRTNRALFVDDDASLRDLAHDALKRHDIDVHGVSSCAEALSWLQREECDVVVSDLNLGGESGIDLTRSCSERYPDLPVIVITAFGSMDAAIEALRAGAYDFMTKPLDMEALAFRLRRAAEYRALHAEVKVLRENAAEPSSSSPLVGKSDAMRKVHELVSRIADSTAPILITGESGTGKELAARSIHEQSERAGGPFVAVNCAAVPANLIESELFGHVRGAFTDARADRDGLFVQADGGTLFLDEIGEMPLDMQPKLLRALQESMVRPVGSGREVKFNARILSATNRDLETEVEEGRFREDLYYRLNVVQVDMPPLYKRGHDVLMLAQHFLVTSAKEQGREVVGISREAAQLLLDYYWPGNVRQLRNCMERAVTLARHDHIIPEDLPEKIRKYESKRIVLVENEIEDMLTMAELERRYIARVLEASQGNKTQAAKILGFDRRTLYRKLERYESEPPPEGPDSSPPPGA